MTGKSEAEREIEYRDWWTAAGQIVGLELHGWTFDRHALFWDKDTSATVELTGSVAKRLLALEAKDARIAELESQSESANLIAIIADIREKSGVGARPMLGELADVIGARIAELEAERDNLRGLINLAHPTMIACGWHLAIAAEPNGDGVLEAACTEIADKFADAIRGKP